MPTRAKLLTCAAAFGLGVGAGVPVPTQAQDAAAVQYVRSCMKETRAPGTYAFTQTAGVPRVAAAQGGSERGAHDINDCLQDRYSVQYGAYTSVVSEPRNGAFTVAECKTTRNQQKVIGGVLTAGVFAAAGATGAGALFWGGVAAGVTGNREYRDCLDRAGVSRRGSEKQSHGHFVCSRSGGGMYGGSGYC